LLLHPTKGYDPEISHGYTERILDVFDQRVQGAYLQRRQEWLGESAHEVSLPLLTRYVVKVASDHGWSLGRTISWLRMQREVQLFREGMHELISRVEANDHAGVGEILSELDKAAETWAGQLGTKTNTRKLSLQVAIPIISPSVDISIPKFTRTPGQKLLVLIDHLLR
jgi:hypothetical protein